ncbi:MAG: hypothetical protein V4754_11145 [Pseudomonadota bacterium]
MTSESERLESSFAELSKTAWAVCNIMEQPANATSGSDSVIA